MYAIQGRPGSNAEWVFCTGVNDVPELFQSAENDIIVELLDWQSSGNISGWEYRIVNVGLIVKE